MNRPSGKIAAIQNFRSRLIHRAMQERGPLPPERTPLKDCQAGRRSEGIARLGAPESPTRASPRSPAQVSLEGPPEDSPERLPEYSTQEIGCRGARTRAFQERRCLLLPTPAAELTSRIQSTTSAVL